MEAQNAPVRRPRPELHTDDLPIDQKPQIEFESELADEVVVAPEVLQKEYMAALAFAEEPVTIRIERTAEKFAPHVIDCWCNGKGPEILVNGKWVEFKALPVGMPVTTKRKYVEIVARAKVDTVNTKVEDRQSDNPRNLIDRYTSSRAPFSVIQDRNPLCAEWLTNLLRVNG